MRIAADRLNDPFPLVDNARLLRRFGGYHQASDQLVMAFFLEVSQIQRIVVHLIIRALAVLFVTDLELQQENDVPIKHNCVHPFSHARDRIFKDDPAVRKCAQLILENRDLRFPCVILLNCRLRRNVIGMDDAEDFSVTLPQEICY